MLFDKKSFINDMKIIKVPSKWSLNDGLPMFAIKEELDNIEWN